MYNIRRNCFETNSSSESDYFDFEDEEEYSIKIKQTIRTSIIWLDDVSDERMDEIRDAIYNGEIDDELFEQLAELYEDESDADDPSLEYCEDNYIDVSFQVRVTYNLTGGYAGDRENPPEAPDVVNIKYNEAPESIKGVKYFNSIKENIMDIFKNKGWIEIIGIEDIGADPIDKDEIDRMI